MKQGIEKNSSGSKLFSVLFALLGLVIGSCIWLVAYLDHIQLGLNYPTFRSFDGLSFYTIFLGSLTLVILNIFFLKQKSVKLFIILSVNTVLIIVFYLLFRYFLYAYAIQLPPAIDAIEQNYP